MGLPGVVLFAVGCPVFSWVWLRWAGAEGLGGTEGRTRQRQHYLRCSCVHGGGRTLLSCAPDATVVPRPPAAAGPRRHRGLLYTSREFGVSYGFL